MTAKFRTASVDVMPPVADMEPGTFYLWESDTVGFLCPCGCGEDVVLPTSPDAAEARATEHLWHFDPATSTLAPSVSHRAGCKSHYTITAGVLTDHGRRA